MSLPSPVSFFMLSFRTQFDLVILWVVLLCPIVRAQQIAPDEANIALSNVSSTVQSLLADGQVELADQYVEKYLLSHPNDPKGLIALSDIRSRQGRLQESNEALLEAANTDPNSIAVNLEVGNRLIGQQQFAEAMSRYETVLHLEAGNRDAMRGEVEASSKLALQERRSGHQDAALAALQHAREVVPGDPLLLFYFGIQAQQMGLKKDAEAALKEALELRPTETKILYALARVEMDEDKLPAAEDHFRRYLSQVPNDATAHYGLGRLLYQELRPEDAKVEFQRSIDLQPSQTESYYELGQIALDFQRDVEAKDWLMKALVRNPKHGGALTGLGILAYRAKDYATAERYLSDAVMDSPSYQPAHYYRGLALAKLGRKADSDKELATAIDLAHSQEMSRHQALELANPRVGTK